MHTPRLQRPASPPPVRRGASSGTVLPMTSSPPAVPASAAASTAPPPLPVRPPSEPAPSRRPPGPIESDYASRADMLKKRQEKEKELEQRAKAVQDVSETAVKVLSLKKGV